jgi:hypothetical protein
VPVVDVVDVNVAIDVVDVFDVAINVVDRAAASRGPPGPGPDHSPGLFAPAHATTARGMADPASDCPGTFATRDHSIAAFLLVERVE